MKTKLPDSINTIEEAKAFLTELYNNGESYHPEDLAEDIEYLESDERLFNNEEANQLNRLMQNIYDLPGNDGRSIDLSFDPCQFLLGLVQERLHNPTKERPIKFINNAY